jgi:XisH protein
MLARDFYHDAVKSALLKDGWMISADPYKIDLYENLEVEQPMAAERQGQKIIVEIKSFVGRSLMIDFHQAVGQYMMYRMLLEKTAPDYRLYLAIDDITHISFFKRAGMEFFIQASQIDLLVVDVDRQEIVEWIS